MWLTLFPFPYVQRKLHKNGIGMQSKGIVNSCYCLCHPLTLVTAQNCHIHQLLLVGLAHIGVHKVHWYSMYIEKTGCQKQPLEMQQGGDATSNNHVTKTGKAKDMISLILALLFAQLLIKPRWVAWKKVIYARGKRANH